MNKQVFNKTKYRKIDYFLILMKAHFKNRYVNYVDVDEHYFFFSFSIKPDFRA